ncbi:MAG: pro-sigmaK processing inhibitor BofA family protein [Candidatus Micrarchaeota archaeon]|nr:pro-sigmaK processing inhibitor BofA family protein [Candidatus Micrarchaeota archaeon]
MIPYVLLTAVPIGSIVSILIVIAAIFLILAILFKIGSVFMKFIFGIIANSLMGLLAIFALNYFFNVGIAINTATLVATALFGLPAVGTLVLVHILGGM